MLVQLSTEDLYLEHKGQVVPNPPFPPFLTGDDRKDIELLYNHLTDLSSYLAEGEPDTGWSSSGFVVDKVLTAGDTLTQTQNVLSTLIDVLKAKGILDA